MITLKNIHKEYNGVKALNGITLNCKDANTTLVIGPSGCGKSTLLRIITGLIKPDAGQVKIYNQLLTDKILFDIRRKMGYVIQDGGLFPHLTALENITLMANYLKWDDVKINERVKYLSELTHYPEQFLGKYPIELSGGQAQRVSIMRALMLDPDILLLDEPLGSLDPLIRFELQKDLKNIFSELKKNVVLVTHDLNEAVYFADKIVLIKDGQIEQEDEPGKLFANPKTSFVEKFINAQISHINIVS